MRKAAKFMMKRRKGIGLATAVTIVLVGTLLIASIFEMTMTFLKNSTVQRATYEEHVKATNFIEAAKGYIIKWDKELPPTAALLHGDGYTALSADIDDLTDLQITGTGNFLSKDEQVPTRNGIKLVTLRVYDANYLTDNVKFTDPVQLAQLPAPLLLGNNNENLSNSDYNDIGNSITQGKDSGTETQLTTESLEFIYFNYGAYIVRVSMYDRDNSGNFTKLNRDIEEAFYYYRE